METIRRFTVTERTLHWVHAVAFFALLATGLVLYLPELSELVARRNLVKNLHIWVAVGWAVAIVLTIALGNRRALRETWSEVETIDADDRRWLTLRRSPQGRFNAGQKLNVILTVAFALLFVLSGFFLWLGERNNEFRFEGTVVLHDALTWASIVIVTGHLYLAIIHPATRHALKGMTTGDVDVRWAARHHPKWVRAVRARERDDQR